MGSRIEWLWQDAGSASGHMQKVVVRDEPPQEEPTPGQLAIRRAPDFPPPAR